MIAVIGPEASSDPRRFARAVDAAIDRLRRWEVGR